MCGFFRGGVSWCSWRKTWCNLARCNGAASPEYGSDCAMLNRSFSRRTYCSLCSDVTYLQYAPIGAPLRMLSGKSNGCNLCTCTASLSNRARRCARVSPSKLRRICCSLVPCNHEFYLQHDTACANLNSASARRTCCNRGFCNGMASPYYASPRDVVSHVDARRTCCSQGCCNDMTSCQREPANVALTQLCQQRSCRNLATRNGSPPLSNASGRAIPLHNAGLSQTHYRMFMLANRHLLLTKSTQCLRCGVALRLKRCARIVFTIYFAYNSVRPVCLKMLVLCDKLNKTNQ